MLFPTCKVTKVKSISPLEMRIYLPTWNAFSNVDGCFQIFKVSTTNLAVGITFEVGITFDVGITLKLGIDNFENFEDGHV